MNDIAFAPIREVAVGLPDADHFSTATTVSGMMGILMSERWPKRANDTVWQHALATCVRAVQLETDTTKARKAFVAAARDAGLKVLPDDEQKPRIRARSSASRSTVQWRQPHTKRERHSH
ncbi:DUF982 domain-containing protein [Rhizobium mesosinicum]|uniref:DUF982 domain-containing protein n=1 Tax=Rhizobium mesosinicum TaxID=335017 RepID=A0ABS7GXP9_9HYPH|nr:DUF982 domain-containing protein [Rhizobium mesosinicum]MBW9054541.1 DUF982 domain-containing protein [Rhizobium mesosinicum]